jgi:hypothetical protein
MKKKKKGLLRRLSSFDDIRDNFNITKDLVSSQSKTNKKEKIVETFNDALKRFNITDSNEESHLTKTYKSLKVTVISSFVTSLVVFAITTNNILSSNNYGFVIYFFYLAGLAILLQSFKSAFRCYQIRERALGGLSIFFKKPKEWYPKKYIYKKEL